MQEKNRYQKILNDNLFEDNDIADYDSIFNNEEFFTNQRIIKLAACMLLYGPFLMLVKMFVVPNTMTWPSLLLFTMISVIMYAILYALTFWTPCANHHGMKYAYVFIFNCLLWILSFCPGVEVKLGFLIFPLITCIYFNERFMVVSNVLSFFTMIFCIITEYFHPFDKLSVRDEHWLGYNLACMSIEFLIFLVIQFYLIRRARKLVIENATKNQDIKKLQHGLVTSFATLVEFKDSTTAYHIKKVSAYTKLICEELAKDVKFASYLDKNTINLIVDASVAHDLGKIAIPDTILTKNTVLTAQEFAQIKQHPLYGAQIIERYLKPYEDKEYISIAKDIALFHHEWWNGNGYPYGQKEKDIPLAARIVSVADVLDSLLSNRPYKKAYDIDKAYEIINEAAGYQFDEEIVAVLPKIRDEVQKIAAEQAFVFVSSISESE